MAAWRSIVPNAISSLRLVVAIALPFVGSRALLVVLICLCAASDLVDGPIARRLGVANELGARVDTAADIVFSLALLVVVWQVAPHSWRAPILVSAAVIAAVRLASLVISRIRFGRLVPRHTIGNKIAGAALLAAAIVSLFARTPVALLIAGVFGLAAGIEELVISATASDADPNRRSYWRRA